MKMSTSDLKDVFKQVVEYEEMLHNNRRHLAELEGKIRKMRDEIKILNQESASLDLEIEMKELKAAERNVEMKWIMNKEQIYEQQNNQLEANERLAAEKMNESKSELIRFQDEFCAGVKTFCQNYSDENLEYIDQKHRIRAEKLISEKKNLQEDLARLLKADSELQESISAMDSARTSLANIKTMEIELEKTYEEMKRQTAELEATKRHLSAVENDEQLCKLRAKLDDCNEGYLRSTFCNLQDEVKQLRRELCLKQKRQQRYQRDDNSSWRTVAIGLPIVVQQPDDKDQESLTLNTDTECIVLSGDDTE